MLKCLWRKHHSSPESLTPRPSSCPPPHSDAESPSLLTHDGRHNTVIKLQYTIAVVVVVFFFFFSCVFRPSLQNGTLAASIAFHSLHTLSVDFEADHIRAAILLPIRSWNSH